MVAVDFGTQDWLRVGRERLLMEQYFTEWEEKRGSMWGQEQGSY